MKPFKALSGIQSGFEGKKPSAEFKNLSNLRLLKQVHGDQIHSFLRVDDISEKSLEGDALISTDSQNPIAVKTADCVPILIAHPQGLVAAVHAGWKGSRLRILEKVLRKIQDEFQKDLSEAHIAIGPCICAGCYEVGADVASEFEALYLKDKGGDKFLLDLKSFNRDLALQCGVPASQIEVSQECTLCQPEDYYSYRRECKMGREGQERNYSWIKLS